MRFFKLCTAVCSLFALVLTAAPLKTGSKLGQLPSPKFLDGTDRNLNDFLGKKFVVLFLWEKNPASLAEFSQFE